MLNRRSFLGAIGLLTFCLHATAMVPPTQKVKPQKLATVTLTISGMI